MSIGEPNRGWARAKQAMRRAVVDLGLPEPEIDWVKKVGEGPNRSAFAAEADVGHGESRVLVALVPHGRYSRNEPGDVEREVRLLRFLAPASPAGARDALAAHDK